uniref:BMERB domain-containing protein n=1 Tax=Podarcis muralis TaxID=64176 RepID=A0A670HRI3_PODMU
MASDWLKELPAANQKLFFGFRTFWNERIPSDFQGMTGDLAAFSSKNNHFMHSIQLTSPDKSPEITRGHFKLHSPAFQRKGKARDKSSEIASYVPHYSLHNCPDSFPLAHNKSTCHVDLTSPLSYPHLEGKDYRTEDAHLGNWVMNSEPLISQLYTKNSGLSSADPDDGDENAKEQHDKHLNKAKNKIMRRLTLSMEQKPRRPAPDDAELDITRTKHDCQGIPDQKNAYFNRYENIPKQSSCGQSQKFSDNHSPVLSPGQTLSKNVGDCPKEHTATQPKSPLRLIAKAIKKSIIEPLTSPPAGLKKAQDTPAKFPLESTFFNFPQALVRSASLRCSKNHGDYNVQTQELSVLDDAEKRLGTRSSNGSHFSSSPREEYSCVDKGTSFPVYSAHSSPSQSLHKPEHSSSTNADDVPTLLERFTLKENLWKSARDEWCAHNQKNTRYSSLRHRNKNADAVLDGPEQRKNVWNLFSSFRNKADVKVKSPVSPCTIFDVDEVLNSSSKGEYLGKQTPSFKIFISSCCFKQSMYSALITLRRNRKLEKETKQLVKQEELKRLHKAQAIQRLLEEVEEKQRALEVYGVQLERELRGESDSSTQDETQLLHEWFELVLEKNKLMRYESELLIMILKADNNDIKTTQNKI